MGQEGSIFWIFDGRHVRLALMLDDEPSNVFKAPNWDLLKRFETDFERQLEEFTGFVADFEPAYDLMEEYLYIQYLNPMLIDRQKLAELDIPDLDLVDVLEDYLKNFSPDKPLIVQELITRSFKVLQDLTYSEILRQIIILVENKVLLPQWK